MVYDIYIFCEFIFKSFIFILYFYFIVLHSILWFQIFNIQIFSKKKLAYRSISIVNKNLFKSVVISIFTNPSARQDMTQGQFLRRV